MVEIKNYYGERANERRRQFNNIVNGIDSVLMNNIVDVDASVYENWQGKSPSEDCDIVNTEDDNGKTEKWYCETHGVDSDNEYECEYGGTTEVYQWFAINDGNAEFLKRHNQYITYSDILDTYFWAITHFGTSWDYVDSMVDDFSDMYVGLEDFKDEETK